MFNNRTFALALLLFGPCIFKGNLEAKTLNVHCGTTSIAPNTITAALRLLDPGGPNTLIVFGVCNENVVIKGFNRLTLVGKQRGSVHDASSGTSQAILVVDSIDIVFRQLTIDGGLVSVQCDDFSVCRFTGDNVLNGRQGGIQITESRAEIVDTTVRNTDNGITSLAGSSVRIIGGVTLDSNQTGIVVDGGSTMEASGVTITNSPITGAYVAGHGYLSLSSSSISGGRTYRPPE